MQQAKWVFLMIYETALVLWATAGRHQAQLDSCCVFGKARVAVFLKTS